MSSIPRISFSFPFEGGLDEQTGPLPENTSPTSIFLRIISPNTLQYEDDPEGYSPAIKNTFSFHKEPDSPHISFHESDPPSKEGVQLTVDTLSTATTEDEERSNACSDSDTSSLSSDLESTDTDRASTEVSLDSDENPMYVKHVLVDFLDEESCTVQPHETSSQDPSAPFVSTPVDLLEEESHREAFYIVDDAFSKSETSQNLEDLEAPDEESSRSHTTQNHYDLSNPNPIAMYDKSSLTPLQRENRVIYGNPEVIQQKLALALARARQQQLGEEDNPYWTDFIQDGIELDGIFFSLDEDEDLLHPVNPPTEYERKIREDYEIGVHHEQGLRFEMEDEDLITSFTLKLNKNTYPVQLFAIFDGHGGRQTAVYARDNLGRKLQETLERFNRDDLSDEGIWNALKMACVELDEEILRRVGFVSGSTATFSLILGGKLWTANVGDSRTILINGKDVIQLTEDAKPEIEHYTNSIRNRGGFIQFVDCWRVNGGLAPARSFGDHFHRGAVSARPKITSIPLAHIAPGSTLILACDGLYDVASTNQVGRTVNAALDKDLSAETIATVLAQKALKAGSRDNVSTLVVLFPNLSSK
jgi:serine/threonine protein phosphatase PrpC